MVTGAASAQNLTAAIDSLFKELGSLHAVFANAGILPPPVPLDALNWHEWDHVLSVNLTGATRSSMAVRPRKHRLAYVAAKAGLHAAARALALELAPRRIRVNVIAPGLTDTPMVQRIPGHIERGLPSVPLGELVPAEEVAAMAVFLFSDAARHVTGAVFNIDGGRTAG
ncbi:MAG: SDR family oxidoreductase [Acidimicrobiales bacterium]